MSRPPVASSKAILSKIGITVASGGAGSAATLMVFHKLAAVLVVAGCTATVAIANCAAHIAESIWSRRAMVIAAKGKARAVQIEATGDKEALLIGANSEAAALLQRSRVYTAIAQAGLDADTAAQAKDMLAYWVVNPELPEGRRVGDAVLKDILADLRRQPGSPSKGPRPRPSNVVTLPRRGD